MENHVILQHMTQKSVLMGCGHRNVLMTYGMQDAGMTNYPYCTLKIKLPKLW